MMIASDNTTAVSYINKEGGMRSYDLMDLTFSLFRLIQRLSITIRARHIPGRLNRTADLYSRRDQVVNTEWMLHQDLLQRVISLWGRPTVDLMATSLTHRLPLYVSPYPDKHALAVDAMAMSWSGLDAYVFPPWTMILPLLTKLRREECVLTAVLPWWPNRPWFPLLLEFLVEVPRSLPLRHDVIVQPHNDLLHNNVIMLHLHVCRLSSDPVRLRDFRKRCPRELLPATSSRPLATSTTAGGANGVFGVLDVVTIPSVHL